MDLLLVAHILASRDAGREQAAWPPQQNQQQENNGQRIAEQRRDVAGRQLFGDAEHQSADDGADERAHAADGDGDEAEDREELPGIELQRRDRRQHDAADGADHRRHGEAQERHARDVYAHQPRGQRILGAGAKLFAEHGSRQHKPQRENHDHRSTGDPEALRGNAQAQNVDRGFAGKCRKVVRLAAP